MESSRNALGGRKRSVIASRRDPFFGGLRSAKRGPARRCARAL